MTEDQVARAETIIARWLERAKEGLTCHPCSRKDSELVRAYCMSKGRTPEDLLVRLAELGAARGPDSLVFPGYAFGRRVERAVSAPTLPAAGPSLLPPRVEEGCQLSLL